MATKTRRQKGSGHGLTLTNTDEQGVVDVEIKTIKSNRGVRGLTRIFEAIVKMATCFAGEGGIYLMKVV